MADKSEEQAKQGIIAAADQDGAEARQVFRRLRGGERLALLKIARAVMEDDDIGAPIRLLVRFGACKITELQAEEITDGIGAPL